MTHIFFDDLGKSFSLESLHEQGFLEQTDPLFARPIPFDNPLTEPDRAKFPKPEWLIKATTSNGSLSLTARRLLNVLLCLSWTALGDSEIDFEFSAYASDVRRAIGQKRSSGNAQLARAVQELIKINFIFQGNSDYEYPLLESGGIKKGDEIIRWVFTWELRDALANANWWGMIDIPESLKLTSKYALSLYELACLYHRRNFPFLTVTPDQLRELLGVSTSLSKWQAFKTRALEPAIAQLNEKTGFKVSMRTECRRRTGAVHKVKLAFHRRSCVG
jgi:hypothetical protein